MRDSVFGVFYLLEIFFLIEIKKTKKRKNTPLTHISSTPSVMRRPSNAIPAQLRSIIQTEGKNPNIKTCMENIENAKKNEMSAYLSLCHARLNLPSLDSTSRPPA
jgi:hypothetical protein